MKTKDCKTKKIEMMEALNTLALVSPVVILLFSVVMLIASIKNKMNLLKG